MAALLTNGSGVVLATAGGVALAVPSNEVRGGARASAVGTKADASGATGREGVRGHAVGAKAQASGATGPAGATATAIGAKVATWPAESSSGARGDAAAVKESSALASATAGGVGEAAATKATGAEASGASGAAGEAVGLKASPAGADGALGARGDAFGVADAVMGSAEARGGPSGEAVGTATINPADETGQGSGGPHQHDDGVPRISMRAKRDRDAAEFARQQAEEAEQVSVADESEAQPLLEVPRIPQEVPADILSLMSAGWAAPLLVQLGMPLALPGLVLEVDPVALAEQHAAELAADDEEALAVILEVLAL